MPQQTSSELYAKLRSAKFEPRRIRLAQSADGLLALPDISNALPFAPLEKEKTHAWYYLILDLATKNKLISPYVQSTYDAEIPTIDTAEYNQVAAVYHAQNNSLFIKRIASSGRIGESEKTYISLGEEPSKLIQPSFAIDISGTVDAYFNGADSRLYFQKLSRIRQLFKGVDFIALEETQEEKAKFFDNDFLSVGELNTDFVSAQDVKRIAALLENPRLDLEDSETQQKIRQYVNAYPSSGGGIDNEGRLIVHSKKDLKAALDLLEQRFFTSELTGEKMQARSTRPLRS